MSIRVEHLGLSGYPKLRAFLNSSPSNIRLLEQPLSKTYNVIMPMHLWNPNSPEFPNMTVLEICSVLGLTSHIKSLSFSSPEERKLAIQNNHYLSIYLAAKYGHLETLSYLHGALYVDWLSYAFSWVSSGYYNELTKIIKNHSRHSLYHGAIESGDVNIVKYVESALNSYDKEHLLENSFPNPVLTAIKTNNLAVVKYILSHNISNSCAKEVLSCYWFECIRFAAHVKDITILEYLMSFFLEKTRWQAMYSKNMFPSVNLATHSEKEYRKYCIDIIEDIIRIDKLSKPSAKRIPIERLNTDIYQCTDPLTRALMELDKSTSKPINDYGKHGVYITTNEFDDQVVLSKLSETPAEKNSCHVGVSGWYNLDVIATRKSAYGIIIDANPDTALFFDHTFKCIAKSIDRVSFILEMQACIDLYEWENRMQLPNEMEWAHAFHVGNNIREIDIESPSDEVSFCASKSQSWLSTNENYDYIRQLVINHKISVISENFQCITTIKKINELLTGNNIIVDSLYLSNVSQYIPKAEQDNYLKCVALLSNHNTLLIDSSFQRIDQEDALVQRITPISMFRSNELMAAHFFPKKEKEEKATMSRNPNTLFYKSNIDSNDDHSYESMIKSRGEALYSEALDYRVFVTISDCHESNGLCCL